jgi:carbonic anhydrase/SulP family sulfate permease
MINGSNNGNGYQPSRFTSRDLTAGLVVFLVALPLCLGVALASKAPLIAGIMAGIVGGLVVGILSGSHTSVSGPAAGLTAVVAAQVTSLGSFNTFLLAVIFAGVIQIVLGVARLGVLAAFVPTGVIKGLLAAIGIIIILKQIPHLLGHDTDPEGDMSFLQFDQENTFSEYLQLLHHIEPGATVVGILSVFILLGWDRIKALKKSPVPSPLLVVIFGTVLAELFRGLGEPWFIGKDHLVAVPVSESLGQFFQLLPSPDFNQFGNKEVYFAAITIAAVASLETLLNVEAVDKLDPQQRVSPSNRELLAQGCGNICSGLAGGLPITSVIIRSSANINARNTSKWSAIFHGVLLLATVIVFPTVLNRIPLSCLAAILLVTGFKLASLKLFKQMYSEGWYQFLPFAATVLAIVFTDLLTGVLLGIGVSMAFILWNSARRPIRHVVEKHLGGDVVHLELPNVVSFLNRASLSNTLDDVPRGGHLLIDARNTDYIDPDILDLIRDYKNDSSAARGVEVSLVGFRSKYELGDLIQFVDYSSRDLQNAVSPEQVLQILKDGHERFRTGRRLTRDLARQVQATATSQHPLAVVLSCIDSRTPTELIFDMGVGDMMSVRIAGNITSPAIIGSIEYSCAVAGAKLVLVMGHTRCGAVTAAVNTKAEASAKDIGCTHVGVILTEIQKSIDDALCADFCLASPERREICVDDVAKANVRHSVRTIRENSTKLNEMAREGRIMIVGVLYNVGTGEIEFLNEV